MRRMAIVLAGVLAVAVIIGGPASALSNGKPGGGGAHGGGGHNGGTSYTGTFQLVLTDSTDGVGHYGQNYTFTVQTSAPYPFVKDECYQSGTLVYQQYNGYYSGWMWGQTYNWSSSAWKSGAADCTATLYYTDSSFNNPKTMATLSFHVYA